ERSPGVRRVGPTSTSNRLSCARRAAPRAAIALLLGPALPRQRRCPRRRHADAPPPTRHAPGLRRAAGERRYATDLGPARQIQVSALARSSSPGYSPSLASSGPVAAF